MWNEFQCSAQICSSQSQKIMFTIISSPDEYFSIIPSIHRFSFLALPIIIGLGVAIPLLPTGQYNFSGVYACTISPHPFNCHYDEGVPCTRAPNAMYIREGLFIYVLACMFFIIIFISMLAFKVKKQDAEMPKLQITHLGTFKTKGGSATRYCFSLCVMSRLFLFRTQCL